MNRQVKKLAKKSGFIFWDGEPWAPPGENNIDWSCDYSEEFEAYTRMIVQQCAYMANETLGADILKYFGVEE